MTQTMSRVFRSRTGRSTFVALVAALLSGGFAAPTSPPQVTEHQIAEYKRGVFDGCRKQGVSQGLAEEDVTKMCSCVMSVYDQDDWRQAVHLVAAGKAPGLDATLLKRKDQFVRCVGPSAT